VNCHIPALDVIPGENETWQCLLCSDVANLVPPEEEMVKRKHGLAFNERKVAERVLLELYCQYDISLHFREVLIHNIHQIYSFMHLVHIGRTKGFSMFTIFIISGQFSRQ